MKERLKGGSPLRSEAPRRKIKKRRAVELENQFDIGDAPRRSEWWDLKKDGINNSGIAKWLECRHQFWLRYVCGYELDVYNDSLEFGNIFHWLIERWLKGRLKNPERELQKKYHPRWLASGNKSFTAANKQTQETFYSLAAAMWPFYADKYKRDLKDDNEGVEVEFEVSHCLRPGKFITLYGTIDRIHIPAGGGRIITDHKTSSWINEGEIAAALPLNFQLMFYAYADFLRTGKVASAVQHDIIRRTSSKPHKKETLKKYCGRIVKEIEARPDFFFVRIPVECTPAKLAAYRENIINPILTDLAFWASGRGPHYPNPNALIGRYGPCKLFGPITQGNFAGLPRKRPTTRGNER